MSRSSAADTESTLKHFVDMIFNYLRNPTHFLPFTPLIFKCTLKKIPWKFQYKRNLQHSIYRIFLGKYKHLAINITNFASTLPDRFPPLFSKPFKLNRYLQIATIFLKGFYSREKTLRNCFWLIAAINLIVSCTSGGRRPWCRGAFISTNPVLLRPRRRRRLFLEF